MKRIPEPDLMDTAEQAEAYAATDFSEPHNAFVSYFKERFPDFSSGSVLDLGSGTADVIIRFARAYPEAYITGIDGSEAMLDIGWRDIENNSLSERISLKKCFLPDKMLSQRKFDALISNSLLHHLANPCTLWATVKSCAEHRAPVFVMDLMRPDSKETAEKLVQQHAEGAPDILREDFYNSLLAAYTIDEIKELLDVADLPHFTVNAVSDRHLIVWGNIL
jgi:ubiquinone/menaquinone biosynthesis C-methylase UbiE